MTSTGCRVLSGLVGALVGIGLSASVAGEPNDGTVAPPGVTADGRWKKLRPEPSPSAPTQEHEHEHEEMLERLRSIGYTGGSIEDARHGVVTNRAEGSRDALNFYSSGHAPDAILMDMNGEGVHHWHSTYEAAFPNQPEWRLQKQQAQWWRRVELLADGSILAIFEGLGMVKLDRNSKILWPRRTSRITIWRSCRAETSTS